MMPQKSFMVEQSVPDNPQPRLHPRIHKNIRECLQDNDFIFNLVDSYGSPLNLIFPENLQENIVDFQSVYKKHRLRGCIYYVTKPCKSLALLQEAGRHNVGVDVSSARSLKMVLEKGWKQEHIVANGPKNKDYLTLCIKNDVLINIDSFDELEQILDLSKRHAKSVVRVSVRLCGFHSSHASFITHDSTFGINIRYLNDILDTLLRHKDMLDFKGFSFHLAGVQDEIRLLTIENILDATLKAIKRGLCPRFINIGGGYPIMYADSCAEWNDYVASLKQSVMGNIPLQTWNNTGLGYRAENGVLSGTPAFIDHAPFRAKGEMLDFLLSSPLAAFNGRTFAEILRDSLLELHIEPGKSLMDQCGVTIGKVSFTKESALGKTLVGLDMNRSNIQSVDQKLLTEPVVLYREVKKNKEHTDGVFYMGNLCLAHDMIQYRKTYPGKLPKQDDVVVFVNTAAYLMDFVESESLMQPVAKKIALKKIERKWMAFEDHASMGKLNDC